MLNTFELTNGFDPLNEADASPAADGDGFSNLEEFVRGSDPLDPAFVPRSNNAMPAVLELLLLSETIFLEPCLNPGILARIIHGSLLAFRERAVLAGFHGV